MGGERKKERKEERRKGKNSLITDSPEGHHMSEQDVSGRASFDFAAVWSFQRMVGDNYLYFLVQNIGTVSSTEVSAVSWPNDLT